MSNPRVHITKILHAVITNRQSLDSAFAQELSPNTAQASFIKAACFGVLRHYLRLQDYLSQLLDKPLKPKDQDVMCLLLCGLYEMSEMHTPDHAVVSETVNAVQQLRKNWARGLVNAVLRNARRHSAQLDSHIAQDAPARLLHPDWLIERLRQDWPDNWQAIIEHNNLPPPMSLRIDTHQLNRDAYLSRLASQGQTATANRIVSTAVRLNTPVDVHILPGFNEGQVSVQDAAAQLAAELLKPQAGERILDACAAPGGKTLHLLQAQPDLAELIAVDNDALRLQKVKQNLDRARLNATLLAADASQPADWWDGQAFDKILLDAPCSATGVIRRHPDIKLLRQPDDLPRLADRQAQMLDALWPCLKSGGMLLYATCSVLKIENEHQIHQFLARHPDACCPPVAAQWGLAQTAGRQILPGMSEMDGFFYAPIHKQD